MTDFDRPALSDLAVVGPLPAGDVRGAEESPRAASPTPSIFPSGRAHVFREKQARRRSARRQLAGYLLVAAILVLGILAILTAKPFIPSSGNGLPISPGPPGGTKITVSLGTPSVKNITCGSGGTAYAESIPWVNSSYPISAGDVYLQMYEIWDRDNIPDPSAVANVTPSNVCAGAAPTSMGGWYVVLTTSNGTNLLTYTDASAWASVTHGIWNIGIESGYVLVLVTYASLAGTGRGFAVAGSVGTSIIYGSIPL